MFTASGKGSKIIDEVEIHKFQYINTDKTNKIVNVKGT